MATLLNSSLVFTILFLPKYRVIMTVFALIQFWGDNTRFFKNGHRFFNLSGSGERSFCGSSNRIVGCGRLV